ncbi:MAG: hypothetical protein ACREMD_09560 [Gemmatimonadota bacterium]
MNYLENFAYYSSPSSLRSAVTTYPTASRMTPPGVLIGGDIEDENVPIYVDAQPMPDSYSIDGKNNLVWLHYFLFFGDDVKYDSFFWEHRGDWEHICVMVEEDSPNNLATPPVRIHWHHHGNADIAATAYADHSDAWGSKHPRVYIEAGAHGMYREPGDGLVGPHNDDGGSPDYPLNNPIVFMTDHWSNRNDPGYTEKEILQIFNGQWGSSESSPHGPMVFNNRCDHDYKPNPDSYDFYISGCGGI